MPTIRRDHGPSNTPIVSVPFSGFLGTTIAAHIHWHRDAFDQDPDRGHDHAPTFAGIPLGVTSEIYSNTLDVTLATSYSPRFVTTHDGTTAGAEADLVNDMTLGDANLKIHASFGSPTRSLALIGLGLAGMGSYTVKPDCHALAK